MHPARNSISFLFKGEGAHNLPIWQFVALTLEIWAAMVGIAFVTSNIADVLGFVGALAATPLSFVFPMWFYIRIGANLSQRESSSEEVLGSSPPAKRDSCFIVPKLVFGFGCVLV